MKALSHRRHRDGLAGISREASRRLLTRYIPPTTRKRQIKLMSMVPAEKVFRKGRTTLSEVDWHTPGYGTVQFFV